LSVVAALALGLMAKPMLVTLPFVLLLLDYWPLGRFAKAEEDAGSCHVPASPRPRVPASSSFPQRPVPSNVRLVVEKIPLFVLAAASCAVTLWAQRAGEAVIDVPSAPLGLRLANALVSYTAYIGQSFWPAGLAAFYPHPGHYADPWKYLPAWKVAGAAALLAAVSALALIGRRKYPYLLVGWLWFLGMLVPVIGLVQVGKQAMADRYMYLPQIGLAIALAWAFFGGRKAEGGRMKDEGGGRRAEGGGRKAEGGGRKAEGGRMKAEGGGMRDEGGGRKAEGGRRKAEGGGRKAEGGGRKAEGGGRKAEGGPGEERAGSGEGAKAQSVASSVILPPSTFRPPPSAFRLPPSAFVAVAALTVLAAAAWKQTTYWRNAEALWRRDYDITRGDDACNGLGNALYIEGRSDDAAEWFRKAIALSPRWVEPACRLGALLVAQGRLDEAIEHFERAARSAPDEFGARERLEETRALRRRLDEDIARLRKALEREPDRVNLHHLLAKALLARGRPAEALQQWCEILRLEPRNMALMNNMAWLLATDPEVSIRNAAEAVRLAQGAAELAQDRDPTVLDTLAAAQAEAGRFEEALATAGKALDLAIAQGKTALANSLRARIELYRAGKPFRDQRQGGKG
jgi:tetratricopeptide (TPR) repeat protein